MRSSEIVPTERENGRERLKKFLDFGSLADSTRVRFFFDPRDVEFFEGGAFRDRSEFWGQEAPETKESKCD